MRSLSGGRPGSWKTSASGALAETQAIKAVELMRRIRGEQAAALAGKSEDEVLAFFHRAAKTVREDASRRLRRPANTQSA